MHGNLKTAYPLSTHRWGYNYFQRLRRSMKLEPVKMFRFTEFIKGSRTTDYLMASLFNMTIIELTCPNITEGANFAL
jgi:hypothetical protein